jgi:copper oxidase (laccase) domain-containing protein
MVNKIFALPRGKVSIYTNKPDFDFIYLKQVHSSHILDFEQTNSLVNSEADGIRFKNASLLKNRFAIKTADCLPVTLIGKESSIVLHVGWRGLQEKILLDKKVIEIEPYFAFIGPSIQKDAFIVTSEFKDNFPDSQNFTKFNYNLTFNLQQEAVDQLLKVNPIINIQNCAECTFNNHQYNSYRRDKTNKRNWNIYSI